MKKYKITFKGKTSITYGDRFEKNGDEVSVYLENEIKCVAKCDTIQELDIPKISDLFF